VSEPQPPRAGFVAVVGRPNVGKSTFVNHLVGQKVAIVSAKPQTTRNRILAVVNRPGGQIVLFDTPGIHKPQHRMNERMVDVALRSVTQVEVILWLVDVTERPGPGERAVLQAVQKARRPVVLGLNKIDKIPKPQILPAIDAYRQLMEFTALIPLSALRGENVDVLADELMRLLPESEPLYPEDFLTDQPERFFVAEMVREKILHHTREEIPYTTGVVIESWKEEEGLLRIQAQIIVDKDSQKGILIGRGGAMLKTIGTEARQDIEAFLGTKIFLGLFVKVREGWREDPRILEEMGLGGGKSRD
jgi:GTP-binding protein Era